MQQGATLLRIPIVTSTGGSFSATVPVPAGRLTQYRFVPVATALATGADLAITGDASGFVYAAQTDIGSTTPFTKAPRQPIHDATGTASLYSTASVEPVEGYMFTGGEMLDVTITDGGDTKSATLFIWIG